MADEFENKPPIYDKVNSMLVNNPQPQSSGLFTDDDRKMLREARDGVTRLLEWKEGHTNAHEKNEDRVETRLNDHSGRIADIKSSIDTLKGYAKVATIVTLISAVIGGVILFVLKYAP